MFDVINGLPVAEAPSHVADTIRQVAMKMLSLKQHMEIGTLVPSKNVNMYYLYLLVYMHILQEWFCYST